MNAHTMSKPTTKYYAVEYSGGATLQPDKKPNNSLNDMTKQSL